MRFGIPMLASLALGAVAAAETAPFDLAGLRPLGAVTAATRTERGATLACADGAAVHLAVLAPDLVRVRARFAGQAEAPDHSWAIAKTDWPAPAWEFRESAAEVTLRTAELEVVVQRDPLLVRFRDARTGRVLHADARPMARDPRTGRIAAAKRLGLEERFYGLGEKAARLEKRRGQFVLWNSDTPGYVEGTDPLYQSIPFYLGWEAGETYGVFHDNSHRSGFDFGRFGQDAVEYVAVGGELDYYFFRGPAMKRVVERYTELTGRMPLPPLWALGNQQSRYSYYPDAMVERVAQLYRAHDLPLDVLYLDIHYMNGYRVFTWDPQRFPRPAALNARLAALGVKTVTIVDPGVKFQPPAPGATDATNAPELAPQDASYFVFNQGVAGDFFLRRKDGSLYLGEVWPGKSVFVDYTRDDAARWWGDLHRTLLDQGVDGIWTDMNEPSDFVDKSGATQQDVVFHDRGTKTLYGRHRNLFALHMARATYEGLARLRPDERPFVITRAGYAGIQRWATVWTGDNNATWDALALNVPMFATLGLSGEAFVGADVPGFIGRASPELLVRSYQLAVFAPLLRNHAAIDNYDHEPWRYGPVYADLVRESLRLRYRLLPFLYTTLEEAHRTGVPLFRPLVLNFPQDENTLALDDQFMVGNALLVAPILRQGERARDVYLPAGRWYDFATAAPLDGGRLVRADAPLAHTPIYVRGGSIVPSTIAMNHVGEKPWNPLRFDVWPDATGAATGELYEDDGVSPAYRRGVSRRTTLRCTRDVATGATRLAVEAPAGAFRPAARNFEITLHAAPATVRAVTFDGKPFVETAAGADAGAGWFHDAASGALTLRFADDGRAHDFELR